MVFILDTRKSLAFFLLLVSLFPFPVSFALFLFSSLSCSQRDKTNGLEYDFPSSWSWAPQFLCTQMWNFTFILKKPLVFSVLCTTWQFLLRQINSQRLSAWGIVIFSLFFNTKTFLLLIILYLYNSNALYAERSVLGSKVLYWKNIWIESPLYSL